ncbi:chondroitin sulfate synthase 1 [Stomoxys calcitrans]|uniref:chondroitin sulfate synthase 1 n=1 Tax=Stomoxys calcitrans TaxID=35570 RepID=UPI0027E2E7ED|nr:chondroitin sulfate synthase 1 [Stomoxys calcitrans]XP_013109907.2 chondroitin sulfate synthase 1 [Stomoxys calcitrans]XP_013109908.2 chondroitin sulfate synthase 1 [Stomoxys calcitrans]XP_013109909.2 chondroitin sulfate synthase 1 [Stomoxys calcitrans]XP_013109910.2 chondroitin sulfate synthase 1 [Stomoxys calcitrans]XP_013109911.2 chondroitin sulfate synthase 1 [Stomoxys calcitrans]XP_013109912.2 chondroitin sulfate synthase 1 [Stomoxys calcitrans]XP_013109913.2 chondroitin sulfate synt
MMMSKNSMTKRKTLIFACFGIAIGLCIGTVLKNYRALEIVKRCNPKPNNQKTPFEIIGLGPDDTIQNSQKNLVFVGVMTAKNFIEGRAKAVYDTWGKEVPGRIAFFSSEGSFSDELPVVGLKNVDDRYPPQKKSFMMLYYMYENFIDKFEWFIRADDDVYIEPQKLENFLRSIDSSKPQFIGQAGKGNTEEFGLLSLEFDENFCMGGPGVILSSETLRRVAPHIPTCLKNLYSTHEDVEVGRCVQKFAGIPCTWNYEMQYILRHNSSGRAAFTGKLKRKEIHNAISLHPIKQAPLMYRLHSYIQGLKAEEMRQESLTLHRDIKRMAKYLEIPEDSKYLVPGITLIPEEENSKRHIEDHNILGISPDLNKCVPKTREDLLEWSFIARGLYSIEHANPKHKIDSATREGLEDVITEVMENINNYSRQRGRVIEFRELLYGYTRLNALHGQDLILDLLLIYKKYRGKKMTVPVRRHLYVQRAFTGIFIKEFEEDFYNTTLHRSFFKNILNQGVEKLSNHFSLPGLLSSAKSPNGGGNSKIVFVLPIAGRLATFQRFLEVYESVALKEDKNCDLLVVIFGKGEEVNDHLELLKQLKGRNIYHQINYILRQEEFSRGVALDTAARSSYIHDDNIILFIDVDMIFKSETLQRIRMNTVQGKQVYLPIVFSQYDPRRQEQQYISPDEITNESGYFRQFGFGICAIYKSDIMDESINGFDKDITGWGLEDVKFLEKIVKNGHHQNSFMVNTAEVSEDYNAKASQLRRLSVFRAPDPSLVHIYHDITCDVNLDVAQYNMCLGTKANSLGSTHLMENLFYDNFENVEFIKDFNRRKEMR